MKKTVISLLTLTVIMPSASAVSGPCDIIPAPVRYEILKGEYSPRHDGGDVHIHLGDKRFIKEINSLNIPEYARDEATSLRSAKRALTFSLFPRQVYSARKPALR